MEPPLQIKRGFGLQAEVLFLRASGSKFGGLETTATTRTQTAANGKLLPGHLHGKEVIEDLTSGVVLLIPFRTPDVEVQLLGRGVDLSGGALLVENRVIDLERLSIPHSLRHHEVHLVVLVEALGR